MHHPPSIELRIYTHVQIASIGYHFGSKEGLVTAAVVEGLDRWLERVAERLDAVGSGAQPAERFQEAAQVLDATRSEHEQVARAFVVALARGHHDSVVAERLIEGFLHTRPLVAGLLDLGSDDVGIDAGGLVHALFTGLLAQALVSEDLVIDADRVIAALERIADAITRPKGTTYDTGTAVASVTSDDR